MKRTIRCKRAIRHAYAGKPAMQWYGLVQGRGWDTVLKNYDSGRLLEYCKPDSSWVRWAAACRGT